MNPYLILIPAAFLGLWLFINLFTKLRECFIPIVVAGGAVCLLYLTGFFGALKIGLYGFIASGIAALIWSVATRLREIPAVISKSLPVILYLLICCLVGVYIFRGVLLCYIDDATHWYLVSKSIWAENALPSTPDIKFQTYIPGVALWNYLLAQGIGFSFNKCLLSQFLLLSAAFCSFLGILPKDAGQKPRQRFAFLALILLMEFSVYGFVSQPFSLTPDLLLALLPASALCMLFYSEEKPPLWAVLLTLCFSCLIKTTSMLFSLAVCLFMALGHKHGILPAIPPKKLIPMIVFPLLLGFSYHLRARFAFPEDTGFHVVSLSRYLKIFSDKGLRGAVSTVMNFAVSLVDLYHGESGIRVLWCLLLIMNGSCAYSRKKELPCTQSLLSLRKVFHLTTIVYLTICCLCYIFSMSTEEAATLNELNRYFSSIAAFDACITLLAVSRLFSLPLSERNCRVAAAIIISVNLLFVNMSYLGGYTWHQSNHSWTSGIWRNATASAQEQYTYQGRSYLVMYFHSEYMESDSPYGMEWYMNCYLRSEKVQVCQLEKYREHPEILDTFDADYVVFLGSADSVRDEITRKLSLLPTDEHGIYRRE